MWISVEQAAVVKAEQTRPAQEGVDAGRAEAVPRGGVSTGMESECVWPCLGSVGHVERAREESGLFRWLSVSSPFICSASHQTHSLTHPLSMTVCNVDEERRHCCDRKQPNLARD